MFVPDPNVAPDHVAVSGTSAASTIELQAGRPYRILASVSCWLNFGADATVGDSSEYVGKGVPYEFICPVGYHGLTPRLIKSTGESDGVASVVQGMRPR